MSKSLLNGNGNLLQQNDIPETLRTNIRIGSKTEILKPNRVISIDEHGSQHLLLIQADSSPAIGRGKGRTTYSRFLELLRGTGHRLGLITNGLQFRLIYTGLDFESWCEWEASRWFEDRDGMDELAGFCQLLNFAALSGGVEGSAKLIELIEDSRTKQADLSSVLRENVRQAVEILLDEVSKENRTDTALFDSIKTLNDDHTLSDAEVYESLLQAAVRIIMRLVVCMFAETRKMLLVDEPVYNRSYSIRTLFEQLEERVRQDGGIYPLTESRYAWMRIMSLFRLIHQGSAHSGLPLKAYGGILFLPGVEHHNDAVIRTLHILEHRVQVNNAIVREILHKLLRGPLPVMKGRTKTYIEGAIDYTNLHTEFIGLIYEGLLDYRLVRAEDGSPQVFLNIGREPVLPLARLEHMLEHDLNGLKDLIGKLKKEKVEKTISSGEEDEESQDSDESVAEQEDQPEEPENEIPNPVDAVLLTEGTIEADQRAKNWAKKAIVIAGLVSAQQKNEPNLDFQQRVNSEAEKLIKRTIAPGDFYLVRAGNTRKGTGTFYTKPQLAIPTAHRTLEPLCYNGSGKEKTPKTPEEILSLKVCDPACGNASFLVAALHYLTKALYDSLCHHCGLEDPERALRITLSFGRPATGLPQEETLPYPPNDPKRGDDFQGYVIALLPPCGRTLPIRRGYQPTGGGTGARVAVDRNHVPRAALYLFRSQNQSGQRAGGLLAARWRRWQKRRMHFAH